MKYWFFIVSIMFLSCETIPEHKEYIDCQWYLICGRNPLDTDCEYCEFFKISENITDDENKLENFNVDNNDGILCHFIHFYENENMLYFFPVDNDKALTIRFDDLSVIKLCKEFIAN